MEKSKHCSNSQKGDKQLLYRPVSLLSICGKVFEHIIFNDLFKYFKEYNLLSPHQSGFIPGDSCVQQLIAINHGIYKAHLLKFEVCFWISQKLLIRFGMMDYYANLNVTA